MPTLQWLDFSASERDDVLNLLASQKDKSTLDELGVGSVRDAISDHLFPAFSTIQTRAKYFLYVPWILRDLERSSIGAERLQPTLRRREAELIRALRCADEVGAPQQPGLIGRESGDDTQRMPSGIYWSGIRRLDIFQGGGSLAEYLDDLPEIRDQRRRRPVEPEGGEGSHTDERSPSLDPGLPLAEDGFLERTSFDLDSQQAHYLKEKLLAMTTASRQRCLLQWMVSHLDAEMLGRLESPWQLLDPVQCPVRLPAHLQAELRHAYHFALCMRVLTALYCRLLADDRRDLDADAFDLLLADALAGLAQHVDDLRDWYGALDQFWHWAGLSNPRLQRDRPFIDEWLGKLASHGFVLGDTAALTGTPTRRWVQQRERRLKGDLARMGNPPVLQRWKPPSEIGLLDYRWPTARRIVLDVLEGLARPGAVVPC